MASIREPQITEHKCGGTLIAPNVVLSAGHCFERPGPKPRVHLGRLSRKTCDQGRRGAPIEAFGTTEIILHPQYNKAARFDFDAALLVLDGKSTFTPVNLADSDACFETGGGCPVRLLGYGDTIFRGMFADKLQEAFTQSVNRSKCQQQLMNSGNVTGNMICAGEEAGGIDACQGDSGGPMLINNMQVGIISWGDGCGAKGRPGVYASIPQIRPWIDSELARINPLPALLSLSGPQNPPPAPLIASSPPPPPPPRDCDCTYTGFSGGVLTDRIGCKRHLASQGDNGEFCMVNGGIRCASATQSGPFIGAAWKDCRANGPCHCTEDGFSGGVNTDLIGCRQHLLSSGDSSTFCMVRGGVSCLRATPSTTFSGAAQILCS